MTVVNFFCPLDIFPAFLYYLIYFLVFCFAFRLERSFVNWYFAFHVQFQFLVFPYFLSLHSRGRAIAIIVCMFFGSLVSCARVLYDQGIYTRIIMSVTWENYLIHRVYVTGQI